MAGDLVGAGTGIDTTSNPNMTYAPTTIGTFSISAQAREGISSPNPDPIGSYLLAAVEHVPEVADRAEDLGSTHVYTFGDWIL
jgi:hypothetical protein